MVKLIASDMDGTLVNSSHTISDKNVNAIKKAQEKGIEFIITTGRSYEDASPQVKEAGIDCNYLVMNGSELRDSKGNVIQTLYMDHDLVQEVVEKLDSEGLYVELYTTKGIYTISGVEKSKWATATKINNFFPKISLEEAYHSAESHDQYLKVKQADSLNDLWEMEAEIGKILSFSAEEDKLARLRKEIPKTIGAHATGSFSINLEVTDPKANKGEAIKRYATANNINFNEIMTIGDSYNDLTMLVEEFGYTVAMGNAIDEVKSTAKYVTKNNDENGVSYIIKKLVLQGEN